MFCFFRVPRPLGLTFISYILWLLFSGTLKTFKSESLFQEKRLITFEWFDLNKTMIIRLGIHISWAKKSSWKAFESHTNMNSVIPVCILTLSTLSLGVCVSWTWLSYEVTWICHTLVLNLAVFVCDLWCDTLFVVFGISLLALAALTVSVGYKFYKIKSAFLQINIWDLNVWLCLSQVFVSSRRSLCFFSWNLKYINK